MRDLWSNAILYAFRDFAEKTAAFLPSLLAMVSILLLGTLLSWLAKVILVYLLRKIGLERWSDRCGLSSMLRNAGIRRSCSQILGLVLFWMLFISFFMIGIHALHIPATSLLISHFFEYLPQVIVSILILIAGWVLANFLGQTALLASVNAGIDFAPSIARVVRWSVITLTTSMALIHLGIARQIVVAMLSILFGGFILAMAIAFGLGGKDLARQFLEKKMVKKGGGEKDRKEEVTHL
ncbi:MAG: hypothetical protein QHH30_08255 [candidate division NC10 bacterium]|nr:hypothetical protein [candidate division NC10 bacterium]